MTTTKTATAHDNTRTLWIGNDPDPNDRLQIDVSADDYAKIPARGKARVGVTATVTDLRTGRQLIVVGAECGCDSPCALELVRWLDEQPPEPDAGLRDERPQQCPRCGGRNVTRSGNVNVVERGVSDLFCDDCGQVTWSFVSRDSDDGLEMHDNSCGECGHPYKGSNEKHYPECSRIQNANIQKRRWRYDKWPDSYMIFDGYNNMIAKVLTTEETAQAFVTAIESHAALVAALKDILAYSTGNTEDVSYLKAKLSDCAETAREALAQARGEHRPSDRSEENQ